MFQLKHPTRKGQKSKLFTAVAYALVGLLASGSAYAATVEEVDAKAEKNKAALVNLTAELAKKEQALTAEKNQLKTLLATKEAEARQFMTDTTTYLQGVENSLKYLEDSQDEFETGLADKASKQELADGLTAVLNPLKELGKEVDKKASKQELADGLTAVLNPLKELGKEVDKKASKQELADGLTAVLNPLKELGKEVDKKADKKTVDDQFNEVDKFLRTTEKYLEYVDKEVFEESNPDSLVNRVDANKQAIDGKADKTYVDEIALNYGKALVDLKENKADKTELDKKADKTAVEENKELIKATAEAVGETGALVTALTDKVVTNEAEIAKKANQGYVDGMVKQIAERYDPVLEELHENQLTAAEKDEVKQAADTAKKVAAQLDGKADSSQVNQLAQSVNADLSAVRNAVNAKANQADLDKAADTVKKVSNKLEAKADRSQVTQLANAVKADLSTVQNTLKTKANQADLDKVDGRVTKVATVVEAQQTAIQGLEKRVSGFGSQISDLNNRMNRLEDDVESGLAIQSAQAALFQPYRVGHMNVTAGLGGYKGKTALALGVGYRFNERFAAKAGVAADTKGNNASYNLGVNFEF